VRAVCRCIAVLAAALALCAPASALGLERLHGNAATLHWSGPQIIQADVHGDVFLLRGDTLEVYPVSAKSHDFGESLRLAPGMTSGPLLDAAMNKNGDWLVALGSEIHLFVAGKEEGHLPALPWIPVSVGFVNGDPAAIVVPRPGRSAKREIPPVLVRMGHDAWVPEVREELHGGENDFNNEMLFRGAVLLRSRANRYFLARKYAYRIELRQAGRNAPLGELLLGKGKPLLSKKPEEDNRRLASQMKAEGASGGGAAHAFHGVSAILALVEGGPGGWLYALVGAGIAGEQCALDKIDWAARRVERTPISFPCEGRVSVAAGHDGLYFADYSGEGGRYFIAWNALDATEWTEVKDVAFSAP
jgi:hypothetical protein